MKILLQLYIITLKSKMLLQQSINYTTSLCFDNRYLITIQFKVLQPLLPLQFSFQCCYNRFLIAIQYKMFLEPLLNYNKI